MRLPTRLHLKLFIKRTCFGLVALFALVTFPSVTLMVGGIATAEPSQPVCNPVQPAANGVVEPTGTEAAAFTYDECTGLYVSAHYVYNPSTQSYSPLPGSEPIYKCDTSTWQWQETKWQYVASESTYVQRTFYVDSVPAGNGTCEKPAPVAPDNTTDDTSPLTAGANINPASNVNGSNTNETDVSDNTNVTLTNNITSNATSGNVNVTQNTQAGNATSGNALASATVINSVNSGSSLTTGPVATFTKNINGDVNGDIIIAASDLQPSNVKLDNSNNLTINSKTSGTINNNLDLAAKSGDVNTSENTKVGNATSGSAQAMANVVNMLNSYVSAGQSFVGTININGNLNGNILMPPNFLSQLSASGAPHTTVKLADTNTMNIDSAQATAIMNQISSSAKSGQVSSSQNTIGGNATSGNAGTNVEIYNLTGQQITGNNGLLVFVNVMGKWVGVIVGAPAGSHAALLGGTASATNSNNSKMSATTNNAINNNINLAAASGDVNSTRNTEAGDATSGDAATSANIANFSNDSVSFGGWFGILFINVLGNWYGNFGEVAPTPLASSTPVGGKTDTKATTDQPVFTFVPRINQPGTSNSATAAAVPTGSDNYSVRLASENTSKTLAAETANPSVRKLIQSDKFNQDHDVLVQWLIIAGSLILAVSLVMASFKRSKA